MECLSGIINNPVAECFMAPIKEHLGHLMSYTIYMEDMRTNMTKLNDAKDVVEDHKKQNVERCCEVPNHVMKWLEDVRTINGEVESVLNDGRNFFNLINRYKLARKSLEITKKIQSIKERHSLIEWIDVVVPLGRIDSRKASTSTTSSDCNEFQSRVETYNKALEALGPGHKHHMVALWGMGGVGKTTMMEKLRLDVEENKMFSYCAVAVIGQYPDIKDIQNSIAMYLDIKLNDQAAKHIRTDELRKGFKGKLTGGKKVLIILDDVWKPFDLKDIGLSPYPNQGVDFKVLLTSRYKDVCTEMGVKAEFVLHVEFLTEAEAQSLFRQHCEHSDDVDPEHHKIGEDIVKKCYGLPIAIKTMACTLSGKHKDTWKDALSRLQHHGISKVGTIADTVFKTSYDNLKDKVTEATFLLCGLFPEDFNIPTEDLLRYGWGLNLFKGLNIPIREARYRLNTCIERLKHTNLLIESEVVGCVKMHDLVRAFVLDMFSKVEHASIVNHGSKPGWPENKNDVSASCKIISLTCKGMAEFPSDLKFPNVSILKLMQGDKSLRFPRNFYEEMKKLRVISYDRMKLTMLSLSIECFTNLRVLRLHGCSLAFDFSSIGNLLNLEVLSFANSSGIKSLPSTIGNLKKLRVLDVTDCDGLCIDHVVFKCLVRLEELYACRFSYDGAAIGFTGENCNEVGERWKNLSALEFEFLEENAQWKNLSFENLERFKISAGRPLKGDIIRNKHFLENTLKLVSKKDEVLGSRINVLFEKTVVLSLSVEDMNDLEDVEVKSSLHPRSSSLGNLRILVVSECSKLKYLFTPGVAKALSNLEHLDVFNCPVMQEFIHFESGGERVTFPNLKFLSLSELPKLSGLCHNVNIIALPQLVELIFIGIANITSIYSENKSATSCLLREEVLIPKLERLRIMYMENLKEIWPYNFTTREEVKLKEIQVSCCENLVNLFPCNPMSLLYHLEDLKILRCGSVEALFNIHLDCVAATEKGSIRLRRIDVSGCDNLVNLFPCYRMPLLHHLEELNVSSCGSIEALFNINLDSVGETGEGGINSLRSIQAIGLGKLEEVWRIRSGENNSRLSIRGFQAVESISIINCKKFKNVFSPTTTNFDLGALIRLNISNSGEMSRKYGLVDRNPGQEDSLFPTYLIHSFHNLRELELRSYKGVEVIFEIKRTPRSQDNQQRILPYLENLSIGYMERMSHVWKCNWNQFLILHRKPSESPLHNLTAIYMTNCHSIKYLFSPLVAKVLSNLKKIQIKECDGMEEVVSNRDDEDEENITSTSTHTSNTLFPLLDSLTLYFLQNLKSLGGGNNGISFNIPTTPTSFLDQYQFSQADGVSWTLCQYAREIDIMGCDALSSMIPCNAAGQMQKLQVLRIKYCDEMKEVFETQGINKSVITLKLPNLKELAIYGCDLLKHIFTLSTFETLKQLEWLHIDNCKTMKAIVVKEEEQTTTESSSKALVVKFPRLKCIRLEDLPKVVGFFLGTNIEFQWPSLDEVTIKGCQRMTVFTGTAGESTAPQLKYVTTRLGKHTPEPGFNSHQTNTTTLKVINNVWSFHNLIELHVEFNPSVKKIIPSIELLQLQKLEKVQVSWCHVVEEVFEGANSTGLDESQTTLVKLPNLTQVELVGLPSLRHIWKSIRCTVFQFPNLTRVSIKGCDNLEHVFSSSMVGSLLQLQELQISDCKNMEEVFVLDRNIFVEEEEEESDSKRNKNVFPRLKSLKLDKLLRLKGFCLGKADFSFPLLNTLTIEKCPTITTFTTGYSSTLELKGIETGFGWFYVDEGVNSFIKMKQEEFKRDGW